MKCGSVMDWMVGRWFLHLGWNQKRKDNWLVTWCDRPSNIYVIVTGSTRECEKRNCRVEGLSIRRKSPSRITTILFLEFGTHSLLLSIFEINRRGRRRIRGCVTQDVSHAVWPSAKPMNLEKRQKQQCTRRSLVMAEGKLTPVPVGIRLCHIL